MAAWHVFLDAWCEGAHHVSMLLDGRGALILALLALAPAPAQEPMPAITLLLGAPRTLDAKALRVQYAGVLAAPVGDARLPTGAWLCAEEKDFVGGSDGAAFRIRLFAEPLTASDEALGHLADRDRARLRRHRAHIVVSADAATDVRAAYRVLAGVARALLAHDVVGIGASHHGTFARMDQRVRDGLAGDDPLDALASQVDTSLVVFLREARELDGEAMRKAIGAEFGVAMATERDRQAQQDFVVAEQTRGVVNVGGAIALVSVYPRSEVGAGAPAELRAKKALDEHTAVLHLVSTGSAAPLAEAARRRLLGRIAAALWAGDCLGLNWHCDRRLVSADDLLPSKLRAEDPVAATLGDTQAPVLQAADEQAMQKAIEQARATWATAVSHHRGGGELSAKFPFATKKGGHEHIWIAVTKIEGDQVHGTIANDPVDIEGRKLHDPVICKLAELSDWLFLRDGAMVGGYTVKVLEEQQARRPR